MDSPPARQPTSSRRRQQLSCNQCRRRKMRCDRCEPCSRCVKSGIADKCHFHEDSRLPRQRIPKESQVIFPVESNNNGNTQPATRDSRVNSNTYFAAAEIQAPPPDIAPRASQSSKVFLPEDPLVAVDVEAAQVAAARDPTGRELPLNAFWYGSKSVDKYVEPLNGRTIQMPKEILREDGGRTVYHGRSHEMILLSQFADITSSVSPSAGDLSLSRRLRETISDDKLAPRSDTDRRQACELMELLPSRERVMDLVMFYVENFESYYRVLHIPSFRKSCPTLWDRPRDVSSVFAATILAVCAISSCFTTNDTPIVPDHSEDTALWIDALKSWLPRQDPVAQRSLGYLQVNCLYLISCEMKWGRAQDDSTWISTGTLVRTAMAAGLHRNPSDFVKVSPFHAELRRRLWFSILELDLQASLDNGMPQTCLESDFDCTLPSNLDDDNLVEDMGRPCPSQPIRVVTQSSYQILVARSWSLRSRVCRMINRINLLIPYEEVLRMDSEIKRLLEEAACTLRPDISTFRKSMFAVLVRKSLLALHRPFAARAFHDLSFLYSRQVCLETSMTVLAHALDVPDSSNAGHCDDNGGHFFSSAHFRHVVTTCRSGVSTSALIVCYELLHRAVEEKKRADGPGYNVDCPYAGSCAWNHQHRELLMGALKRTVDALRDGGFAGSNWNRVRGWLEMGLELAGAIAEGEEYIRSMREILRRRLQSYHNSLNPQQGRGYNDSSSPGADGFWSSQDLSFEEAFPFDIFSDFANNDSIFEQPREPLSMS